MKIRFVFLILACVLLVAGGVVFYLSRPGPVHMRIELTGTPGMKVAGTYTADGVTHEFRGTLPTRIDVQANEIYYTIRKQEEKGELRGQLFVNDAFRGDSSTNAAYAGVSGHARVGGWMSGSGFGFTTVGAEPGRQDK